MEKSPRNVIVGVRFTGAEAAAARRCAEAAGMPVVGYIRHAVLAAVRRDRSRAARQTRREQERVRREAGVGEALGAVRSHLGVLMAKEA